MVQDFIQENVQGNIQEKSSWWHSGYKLMTTPYNELPVHYSLSLQGFALFLTRGFQSIIPLSFLLIAWLLSKESWYSYEYVLFSYSILESLFYILMKLRFKKLKKHSNYIPLTQAERNLLVDSVLDNIDDHNETLAGWLIDPPESIEIEHTVKWLSWAFFDKDIDSLTLDEEEGLDYIVSKFKDKFSNGISTDIKPLPCLMPTIDDVPVNFKPLVFYAFVGIPKLIGRIILSSSEFVRQTVPGTEVRYWSYTPSHVNSEPPIFFIHGIGVGLGMYSSLALQIQRRYPTRKLFLLEVPYISLDPYAQYAYTKETVSVINNILQINGVKKCSWIGHSFGTIILAWIIKNRSEIVDKVTMIDPICFQLWDVTVANSTLYAKPLSFLHHLCQFFVIQDPIINHAVSRSFQWTQNILFLESLTVPSWIFYSQFDYIINAPSIHDVLNRRLLRNPQPNVNLHIKPISHGGCLFLPEVAQEMICNL